MTSAQCPSRTKTSLGTLRCCFYAGHTPFFADHGVRANANPDDTGHRIWHTWTDAEALPVESTDPMAQELPYGETAREVHLRIARGAYRAERRFGELNDRLAATLTAAERAEHHLAHDASLYGWSLVAAISMLAVNHPDLGRKLAALVQDIGMNGGGGAGDWGTDIYEQVVAEFEAKAAGPVTSPEDVA